MKYFWIAIVVRVQAHSLFMLLIQVIELSLVTGWLGLLLAKHPAVTWIDLNEQGKEGGENVGETTVRRVRTQSLEVARNIGGEEGPS